MRWNVWAAITGKLKMYFHLDKITKLRKVTPDFFLEDIHIPESWTEKYEKGSSKLFLFNSQGV